MSKNNNKGRVLNRMGARELTKEEVEKVTGRAGDVRTRLTDITTNPTTTNPDHSFDE